ncbi:GTPase-activating protein [Martiniozyma asiatica (nom. inval.)]|nr:GTPase-activating protein [Martiniozyma asiatica]
MNSVNTSFEMPSSPQLLEDESVKNALKQDSAFEIMSQRLKQSIKTCDEYMAFLNRKVHYEQRYSKEVLKTYTHCDASLRAGVYVTKNTVPDCLSTIMHYDEKINNIKEAYVKGLQTIVSELFSMSQHFSVLRKQLKEKGNRLEKEVQDAVTAAKKAKNKYASLCSDMEKLLGLDRDKSRITLQGRKTVSEQEDQLKSKIKEAEIDYQKKANTSQRLKNELVETHRPKISQKWKDLIVQFDLGLQIQLEKYAIYGESLIVGMGNQISPINGQESMRKITTTVDVEKALYITIKGNTSTVKESLKPVEFLRHPLYGSTATQRPQQQQQPYKPITSSKLRNVSNVSKISTVGENKSLPVPPIAMNVNTENSNSNSNSIIPVADNFGSSQHTYTTLDPSESPVISGPRPMDSDQFPMASEVLNVPISADNSSFLSNKSERGQLYGVPLEEVPHNADMIPNFVLKCIHLIETYGSQSEGVYRMSPNKAIFEDLYSNINKYPENLSLLDPPETPGSDYVYLIGSLFKKFFAELPEPLITWDRRYDFLQTSEISDATTRQTKLHNLVYDLPDANYFTLRDLLGHFKILEKMPVRMDAHNLAIIWGGNLMGGDAMTKEDIEAQQRVVEDLINFATDIFDYK